VLGVRLDEAGMVVEGRGRMHLGRIRPDAACAATMFSRYWRQLE
jgi:hypothetical protein